MRKESNVFIGSRRSVVFERVNKAIKCIKGTMDRYLSVFGKKRQRRECARG